MGEVKTEESMETIIFYGRNWKIFYHFSSPLPKVGFPKTIREDSSWCIQTCTKGSAWPKVRIWFPDPCLTVKGSSFQGGVPFFQGCKLHVACCFIRSMEMSNKVKGPLPIISWNVVKKNVIIHERKSTNVKIEFTW